MSAMLDADPDTITAPLNYIVNTGSTPFLYVDWPEKEAQANPPRYEQRETVIRNGRPRQGGFDLDTHGFVFADHATAMGDFTDADELKRVYDAEAAELIRRHSGAGEVVVFDHTVRVGDQGTRDALKARGPVKGVHNDYTENSAPRRLRDILGDEEARRRMAKRWAIIQIWRPIRKPVVMDPMALCDARTIPEEGFIPLQRRYRHRTAETYHIAYHPAHQWYWFPRMTRDEALVFKVFDSDAGRKARYTAHTAFDDPTSPADAWPRESIETRTFAFWE